MKVLGRYIKEYFAHHFPDEYYYEEEDCDLQLTSEETANSWLIEDNQTYDLRKAGWLIHETSDRTIELATAFAKWWKERTVETIVIEVPKDKGDEVRSHLKELGYKVLK